MSAGPFIDSRYEANSGFVFPIRIQPETNSLELDTTTNSPPTEDVTADLPTLVLTKSRRGFGVHPRTFTIVLTGDGLPDSRTEEYREGNSYTIPILQASVWDSLVKGDVGTYQGIPCVLRTKTPEQIR